MTDDPTLPYRVAFGLTVFGVLGMVDLVRHPRNPRRLKEYAFLFGVTGAVMLYGLAHDAVTFAIAPEYFTVLKGLGEEAAFVDVARLALMATWTAGLAIGLALLVANNPSRRLPRLGYRALASELRWLAASPAVAIACGAGTALFPQATVRLLDVGAWPVRHPEEVAIAWAIHVGSYAGAALGAIAAVPRVRARRRASKARMLAA